MAHASVNLSELQNCSSTLSNLVPHRDFASGDALRGGAEHARASDKMVLAQQSCGGEVAYFGNFNDAASNALMADKFRLRGALRQNGALAAAF
jgi:hypothetical protein